MGQDFYKKGISVIISLMIRKLLFILAVIFITAGLFLFVKVLDSFKSPGKGALQINTNVKSKVFLNGVEIGTAPLCKCTENETIQSGIYDLRIEPEDKNLAAFSTKVKINGGVLTAVERTFLSGAYASASILTLEKSTSQQPELIITSLPDKAIVTIDSISKGITPYHATDLSVSEHELRIGKEGFQEKTMQIKMIENHKLVVEVYLGTQGADEQLEQQAKTNNEGTEEVKTDELETIEIEDRTVTILDTPNGFLRVRSGAGTNFPEVTRVNNGDTFNLIKEESGWLEIQIDTQTSGFISSEFAKIN